jgi:hypothetical protein
MAYRINQEQEPSMNNPGATRRYVIAAVCGIFMVSLLYQIVKGWDTVDFLLRAIFSTAVAALLWRSASVVSEAHAAGGAGRSFALHALCWAAAALLFAVVSLGR